MFRTASLSIIRNLSTVHTAIHTGYVDCLLEGLGWNAVPFWSH